MIRTLQNAELPPGREVRHHRLRLLPGGAELEQLPDLVGDAPADLLRDEEEEVPLAVAAGGALRPRQLRQGLVDVVPCPCGAQTAESSAEGLVGGGTGERSYAAGGCAGAWPAQRRTLGLLHEDEERGGLVDAVALLLEVQHLRGELRTRTRAAGSSSARANGPGQAQGWREWASHAAAARYPL